jgi:hypothetical protein
MSMTLKTPEAGLEPGSRQGQISRSKAASIRRALFLTLAAICFLNVFLGTPARSQVSTGTINGVVTDAQDSVIVGATVTVKNTDTQVMSQGTTNSTGGFQIGGLILGPYQVTFDATGFKKIVETNVRLEAGSIVKLDERMSPGAATTTVEVNANGTQLETEQVATSTTLGEELVQNAPVVPATGSFRDSTMLVNLTPGASGSFVGVNIAGGRAFAQEVEIDGIPQLFQPLSSTALLTVHPSFDVIAQVYTQPGVPAPEFGRSSGGVVTELTRSGGDQYHGNTSVFFRNTALDARAYNKNTVGKDQQYELPVSVGGPIWIPHVYNGKGRSFFFFNWTRYWTNISTPSYFTVPTIAERGGDFSDQLAQGQVLYDPTTEVAGVRQPFPNNQITPTSSIGKEVVSLFPTPINGSLINNYQGENSNSRVEEHYFIRLDHNLNANQSLHGTYRRDSFIGFQPAGILQNNHFDTTVNLVNPWWDWLISPNLLNHAAASYTFYGNTNQDNLPESYIHPNPQSIVVPGTYSQGSYLSQNSQFTFGPYSPIYTENYNTATGTTYEYDDILALTKGKHSFKFGARFDAFQQDAVKPQGLAGAFNFSNSTTGVGPNQPLTTSSSGNAIASLLLGYVDNANAQKNVSTYGRSKYFAVFAQDSWRVTSRLTASYGIRWEEQTPLTDAKGNMTTMDPTLTNPAAGGLPGALIFAGTGPGRIGSNSFLSTWKLGWSPRVGLAYDLGHNTVVRAGYGILYAPYVNAGWFNQIYDQSGFTLSSSSISPNSGYNPAFSLDGGFPSNQLETSLVLSPTLYNGQNITTLDTHSGKANRLQDNQVWQLDLQHTFKSVYVDIAYVGEVGHHIAGGGNPAINQVDPKYLSLGSLLTQDINSPAVVSAGFTPPYPGFKGSLAQALRPFPQYLGISSLLYPSGSSSWNGLMVKVQKTYSNGFTFLGAYTWSKEFSNVGFSAVGDPYFQATTTQNTYNSKSQKALGDNNIPQNLQLSWVYDLPFGRGKKFLNKGIASYVLGGFGLSALQSYESGEVIRLNPSVPGLPLFNPGLFVNIVPGVKQKLASRSETKKYNSLYDSTGTAHGTKWLNAAAFANPAPYTFGNSRAYLDHLQQLAVLNENLSFYKRTSLTRSGTRYLEIGAEMFNAFNRANYGGLDTNLADNTPNGHFGEYTSEFSNLNFGIAPGAKITEIVMKLVF